MRVKLGILTTDIIYSHRLMSVLTAKYNDEFEVYSFTEPEIALKEGQNQKIDILLIEENLIDNINFFINNFYVIYLVELRDIEIINQCHTIFKYQKIELIVKQIWNLYSEIIGDSKQLYKKSNSDCKTIAFASPCGGCGSSTLAAASATYFAKHNKKVMYLNLEKISSSDIYFHGDGMQNFSDIIFALKEKKANLIMKIEACLNQNSHGVFFFSQSSQILDMYELNLEEKIRLVQILLDSGLFDMLVLDLDFDLTEAQRKLYCYADALVMTNDGSKTYNRKIKQTYQALFIQEQNSSISLLKKIFLIYNKFDASKKLAEDVPFKILETVSYFQHVEDEQILEQLSVYECFNDLF